MQAGSLFQDFQTLEIWMLGTSFPFKTVSKHFGPLLLQSSRASHCESPEFELYIRKHALMAFLTLLIRMNLQYIKIRYKLYFIPVLF